MGSVELLSDLVKRNIFRFYRRPGKLGAFANDYPIAHRCLSDSREVRSLSLLPSPLVFLIPLQAPFSKHHRHQTLWKKHSLAQRNLLLVAVAASRAHSPRQQSIRPLSNDVLTFLFLLYLSCWLKQLASGQFGGGQCNAVARSRHISKMQKIFLLLRWNRISIFHYTVSTRQGNGPNCR